MIDHEAAAVCGSATSAANAAWAAGGSTPPRARRRLRRSATNIARDPEFRQTVEHYIHEFERLLDDVSRGDRGPAVARNYLTSDTGKVYTMLAHAAGRFDQ